MPSIASQLEENAFKVSRICSFKPEFSALTFIIFEYTFLDIQSTKKCQYVFVWFILILAFLRLNLSPLKLWIANNHSDYFLLCKTKRCNLLVWRLRLFASTAAQLVKKILWSKNKLKMWKFSTESETTVYLERPSPFWMHLSAPIIFLHYTTLTFIDKKPVRIYKNVLVIVRKCALYGGIDMSFSNY